MPHDPLCKGELVESRSEHLPDQFIVSRHCAKCQYRETDKGLRQPDGLPVPEPEDAQPIAATSSSD